MYFFVCFFFYLCELCLGIWYYLPCALKYCNLIDLPCYYCKCKFSFWIQALSHTHVDVINSDERTKADVSR